MGILSPTLTREPKTLRGGGTGVPPVRGGGDDGRGRGPADHGDRLRRARLGLAIGLVAVTMFFISFTSALIMRRGLPMLDAQSKPGSDWVSVELPVALLLVNTAVLLLSSVTMEFARRHITREAALAPVRSIPGVSLGEERSFPWLGLTVLLGLGFLFGQWMAWRELELRGFFLSTFPSSSFVYLLTGMHAVHLAGGVLALLYAGLTAVLRRPVESRRIVVDVAAWYWHFMAALWIYVFALLEFAR
jgi:cytochrome c oxidase subunit III